MERTRSALAALGLGVCSVSYDSVDILREFAARRTITFPMLSDGGSEIIRRFGLFNDQVDPSSRDYGIPHPGILQVDAAGVVRARFIEERFFHRVSMPSVLARLGTMMGVELGAVRGEHVAVGAAATQASVHPGNRFTLYVNLRPSAGVHLYGPGVGGGYQGLTVSVEPQPYLTIYPPEYPEARRLTLPWTDEALTGYTEPVRVAIDVALGSRQELAPLLEAGEGVTIVGTVALQACDDRVCWAPETIGVQWHFDLIPPDLVRAPEALQHKSKA